MFFFFISFGPPRHTPLHIHMTWCFFVASQFQEPPYARFPFLANNEHRTWKASRSMLCSPWAHNLQRKWLAGLMKPSILVSSRNYMVVQGPHIFGHKPISKSSFLKNPSICNQPVRPFKCSSVVSQTKKFQQITNDSGCFIYQYGDGMMIAIDCTAIMMTQATTLWSELMMFLTCSFWLLILPKKSQQLVGFLFSQGAWSQRRRFAERGTAKKS